MKIRYSAGGNEVLVAPINIERNSTIDFGGSRIQIGYHKERSNLGD